MSESYKRQSATTNDSPNYYHSSEMHDSDYYDNSVFVGNLSWNVRWQDLKDHMRSDGARVLRADIFTSSNGESKGCGVVEFATREEAQRAIETLNDTLLFNRRIFVRENRRGPKVQEYDHNREGRSRGNYRSNDYRGRDNRNRSYNDYGSRDHPSSGSVRGCEILVDNLPVVATWQALKDFFNENRNVRKTDVYESRNESQSNRSPTSRGTVIFYDPKDAQAAVDKFDQAIFMGNKISVRLA